MRLAAGLAVVAIAVSGCAGNSPNGAGNSPNGVAPQKQDGAPDTGAVTCATGAGAADSCKIGDVGPGGGKVFYVAGVATGSRYMEVAPNTWKGGTDPSAGWGCRGTNIGGAAAVGIGSGKANTAAIVGSCAAKGIAAKLAATYKGGGQTDWFLPAKDELNALYAQKTVLAGSDNGSSPTSCAA